MGEVYRARDTKLGREVALKVLPEAFVSDPERLARLEREARLLASLNHPNIATLHAFESVEGVRFLVMEVVEGQTLGERLSEGPLPVREALDFFRQVADGLASAHRKGVVHRDLKPGNLKMAPGGHAKILDFGLATTVVPGGAGDITNSPTVSVHHAAGGVVQGTAPYMAPEQAKGKPADEKSDAFSFGVTLYEALAGKRAFAGDTVTEVLAAVLEREPDLASLPPDTPDLVRFLLRRCLKKNPDERLRDIGEAKAALAEALTVGLGSSATVHASAGTKPPRGEVRHQLVLGLGALALIGLGLAGGRLIWREPGAASRGLVRRFQIEYKAGGAPSISPDGRHIAYVEGEKLRIRDLDRVDSREVPGSEKAISPFWSPDGRSVAFFAAGFLRRAPIEGGATKTVCELKPAGSVLGATWSPSGSVVVALGPALGLFEVSSEGGNLKPLLKPDPAKGIFDFHWPTFLPDGRSLLMVVHPQTGPQFYLAVFDGRDVRRLLPESTPPVGFPAYSESGHILFSRSGSIASLYAVPFDASKRAVMGEPVRLADDASFPSVSSDGVLAYVTGASSFTDLVLVKRSGEVERTISSGHEVIRLPRVSPDGKRVMLIDAKDGNQDVWVEDIDSGTRIRLTTGPETDVAGSWSSSGERVALMSGLLSDSGIVLMRADGSGQAERLPYRSNSLPEATEVSPDWSADGRFVMFRSEGDLFYGDVMGKGVPVPFAKSSFVESEGRFSPDGRYVAYMSNESGRFEVSVRPFPEGDRKWTVSTNGGALPRWSRQGHELFYVEGSALMAVTVSTRDGFRSAPPRKLFDAEPIGARLWTFSPLIACYDPMPDGLRFVVARRAPSGERKIVVVENWAEELKRRP
jgi:Tol biopolymer transport system component